MRGRGYEFANTTRAKTRTQSSASGRTNSDAAILFQLNRKKTALWVKIKPYPTSFTKQSLFPSYSVDQETIILIQSLSHLHHMEMIVFQLNARNIRNEKA